MIVMRKPKCHKPHLSINRSLKKFFLKVRKTFKQFKLVVVIQVLDCGRGLNRSSTVVESGSFLVALWNYSWSFVGVRGESGYQLTPRFTPVHHDSLRIQHDCPIVMSWRYTVVAPS